MEPVIRPAELRDAPAIARVQVESWKTTYRGIVPDAYLAAMNTGSGAQRWRERLAAASSLVYVAEDEAGVFGFIGGAEAREPPGDYDAELYAIYLLKERQRQLTGQRLTRTLVTGLANSGFHSMFVWVLEQNPSAAFYRRLGGTQIARKFIEIGAVQLPEVAYAWPRLEQLNFDPRVLQQNTPPAAP